MSAATIIFSDLVGFSKKPTSQQKTLVDALNKAILTQVSQYLCPDNGPRSIIALPTGDGVALAFLHDIPDSWSRITIFELLLHLQRWAEDLTQDQNKVELRLGVHVGTIELMTDINDRDNICGDTINYTQRVMDAADPSQVLFSSEAFRHYIGTESPILKDEPFSETLQAKFSGVIEVYAKHGQQILVHKVILEPPQTYWSNANPESSTYMVVGLTDLPKEIVGKFSERVANAKRIAFIQLTGDRFVDSYFDGKIQLADELERFWVFMPEPNSYSELNLPESLAKSELVENCVEKWKEMFRDLSIKYPKADLKLGLFSEPPFFGGSFLDWDRPKGRIHVSPYIWSVPALDCPGYDLEWLGASPSIVYDRYIQGLNYLNGITSNSIVNQGQPTEIS